MLFEYLAHIRKQPKEVRQRFAFLSTAVVTVCIALLWLSTFFLGRLDTTTVATEKDAPTTSTLRERLGIFSKQVHEQIGTPFEGLVPKSEPTADTNPEQALSNTFLALPEEYVEPTHSTTTEVGAGQGVGTSSASTATSTGLRE